MSKEMEGSKRKNILSVKRMQPLITDLASDPFIFPRGAWEAISFFVSLVPTHRDCFFSIKGKEKAKKY